MKQIFNKLVTKLITPTIAKVCKERNMTTISQCQSQTNEFLNRLNKIQSEFKDSITEFRSELHDVQGSLFEVKKSSIGRIKDYGRFTASRITERIDLRQYCSELDQCITESEDLLNRTSLA